VILAVLPLGAAMSWQQFQTDETAMAPRTDMNAKVTQELDRRKIDRLVGNYWDVTPPKSGTSRDLTISPVENCRTPRSVLNSQAWFGLPAKTPSAFLAVRDGSPLAGPDHIKPGSEVTYGGCSLARIVSTYGVPSERVSVGQPGDYSENPDALLLLYPGGLQPEDAPKAASLIPSMAPPAKPQAVQPPELQSLVPFTEKDVCTRGTMLQVIAHQDDDLLFMNPDLADAVKDGRCIRTVYLTAGDAGEQFVYWGGRERGAQAAYAQMYGVADEWSHEQQMLAGRKVTVSYLKDVSQVSLVFLRLPDGNLRGEGFMGHDFASLRSLLRGGIPELRSVDGVNSYTRADLVAALLEIMVRDLPGEIRTLGSGNGADGDHADHHDSGTLTDEAAAAYLQTHAIQHYVGYPVVGNPVNLPEDRITHKHDAFLAYAKHDGAVCQSVIECQQTITYGNYLTRQYPAVTQVTTAP
jgi:LmbE family N-acetylglucosaminyl deacetylase